MNAELLLKHLEHAAETPEAVPLLRRFILDMAVRGKLVSQNPKDEPAAKLLERIAKEKKKLEKAGEIKNEKPLPPISEKDIPFQIPASWEWVRVGNVAFSKSGKTLNSVKNTGIYKKYLRTVNVRWFSIDLSDLKETKFESEELEKYALRNGDLLILEGGEAGRCAVWDMGDTDIYYQNHIHRVRFLGNIHPYFLPFVIYGDFQSGRIANYRTGVTIKSISSRRLASYSFPLPPLAEQKRIVGKVDKLMALCDKLESARNDREESRRRLVTAALHELKLPPQSFAKSARFALSHFADITARPDNIKALRKTILDMAVRGKLVPQNPKDEPAAKLLERIAKEKKKLEKAGEIKKEKPLPPISKKDIPFQIPASWEWVKAGYLLNLQYGKGLPAAMRKQSGKVAVYGSNGIVGYYHDYLSENPAIIIGRKGSAGSVNLSLIPSWATDVAYYLISPYCYDIHFLTHLFTTLRLETLSKGVKPGLNRSEFYQLPIILPPLAEQKRIVDKVDKLMALCDKLESALTATQENRRRLLVALLRADSLDQKSDTNAAPIEKLG